MDKDYKAYEDAKKALEAAKARAVEAKDAVKSARAAVLEALKTVSDPPAVVRLPRHNLPQRNSYTGFRVFHIPCKHEQRQDARAFL